MKTFLLFSLLSFSAFSLDAIYLGGRIGQQGLSGVTKASHGDAFSFGVDVGLRASSLADLMATFQTASHSNNLTLTTVSLVSEIQLGRVGDFGFYFAVGPGFYFFKTLALSESKFGFQLGTGPDLWLDDKLRVGMDIRYHMMFSIGSLADHFYTAMARVGYLFEM